MEKAEYEWVKQTRQILLDQCKELSQTEITKELGFGFQSIRDSLVHVAGCYHAWLGSFVLAKTSSPLLTKEAIRVMKIEDIEGYFQQADQYVETMFHTFNDEWEKPIEKEPSWKTDNVAIRKTPHQLFIHSITHEYHHKGQIAAMLRLLGYIPKNTDILGLPDAQVVNSQSGLRE
ncbi:DinB family protein [Gracilibacillus caseinilyticus]|uniref:DinB family protein n=1 Tax=Gracilibacillus caseinilyticus TaxID=2932256 RepID=A0ABY4EY59_9BACI|nr:DinB family protein [Gracilibacillus caseinilyticus]UOQ48783.1 DinB family protein [Gracilibacillus caseinilyticus]